MFDPKLTAAADPPDGTPRPAGRPTASTRRLALSRERESPSRFVGSSPWRAPKRVAVDLWSAASRQAERPLARRLAA